MSAWGLRKIAWDLLLSKDTNRGLYVSAEEFKVWTYFSKDLARLNLLSLDGVQCSESQRISLQVLKGEANIR